MEEGSKEYIASDTLLEGGSMLENLPTSISLVKKKRRSYGQTISELESPLKAKEVDKTAPLEDDDNDEGSIATEVRSCGDHKALFDMEDDFFEHDEFDSSESLLDEDQIADDSNFEEGDNTTNQSIHKETSEMDTLLVTGKLQSRDELQTVSVEVNSGDSSNHKVTFDSEKEYDDKLESFTTNFLDEASNNQVTDQDILDTVDTLFSEVDVATVTVKDIIRSIEDLFQIKIKKERKALVKDRLFYLINNDGKGDPEDEADDADDPNEEPPDDDDDFDPEGDDDDDDLSNSKGKNSRSHSNRAPKQRKPSHLKIHHEMMRKRQIVEAKVRAEELQDQNQKKLSEEDRKRAELIAKKFETDTEEMRIKRLDDRIALLSKLEQKRLLILKSQSDMDIISSVDNKLEIEVLFPKTENESSNSEARDKDDESDDELDIIKENDVTKNHNLTVRVDSTIAKQNTVFSRKPSPTSVLALLSVSENISLNNSSKKKSFANPTRAKLRNALKAKQFRNGNLWLAKELGYKDVEEHIRECSEVEKKTRTTIVSQEEARIRSANERNERLKAVARGEALEAEVDGVVAGIDDESSIVSTTRDDVYNQDESESEANEEDEEMALAREFEEMGESNEDNHLLHEGALESDLTYDHSDDVHSELPNEAQGTVIKHISRETAFEEKYISEYIQYNQMEPKVVIDETNTPKSDDSIEMTQTHSNEHNDESGSENEFDEHINQSNKTVKNAAWKEMLKKEAEQLKKRKVLRKHGVLVEEEAEEEEEEEGVAGLEDFGFTLNSKKKDIDDEDDLNDDADDDDFDDIVDSLSDNEGDEEAGEAGRKAMALKEEKARHKEIIRRMREGYDGKRGGIAGGGEARGNLRFDQLVAADNRDDARRLGLLNDDELDSDDENNAANADDEIEDEEDLDKILKDRYLNRTEIPEEDFSDSDHDEENDDVGGKDYQGEDEEDDDEKEQLKLAKRFARRARMNRLLELHGDDKEFSQSRLIDQDLSMQLELKSIKNVHSKRRETSMSSFSLCDNSSSHVFPKRQTSSDGLLSSKYLSSTSSLALAMSRSRKRKASFLGSASSGKAAIKAPTISLGHVVFGGDSQSVGASRSASLPAVKNSFSAVSYQRSKSDSGARNTSSLWSRVAAAGFQKNKK